MRAGYTNGEIFGPAAGELARGYFTEFGHVAIGDLYTDELAAAAIGNFNNDGLGLKYHPGPVPGEQAAAVTLRPLPAHRHAHALLAGIQKGAALLDRTILPQAPGDVLGMRYFVMAPNTVGRAHKDREGGTHTVAITTLRGSSELLVEGGLCYPVLPGTVVFLDHDRLLTHQGIAGPTERVGLVVNTNPAQC